MKGRFIRIVAYIKMSLERASDGSGRQNQCEANAANLEGLITL